MVFVLFIVCLLFFFLISLTGQFITLSQTTSTRHSSKVRCCANEVIAATADERRNMRPIIKRNPTVASEGLCLFFLQGKCRKSWFPALGSKVKHLVVQQISWSVSKFRCPVIWHCCQRCLKSTSTYRRRIWVCSQKNAFHKSLILRLGRKWSAARLKWLTRGY